MPYSNGKNFIKTGSGEKFSMGFPVFRANLLTLLLNMNLLLLDLAHSGIKSLVIVFFIFPGLESLNSG